MTDRFPLSPSYFNRDVDCIRTFFRRRFGYESQLYPKFALDSGREFSLDVQVTASGFSRKLQQELEEVGVCVFAAMTFSLRLLTLTCSPSKVHGRR